MQKFRRHITGRPQFWWKQQGEYCWSCFHELRVDFEVTEASTLEATGKLSLKHRKLNDIQAAIGYGIRFTLRYSSTGFSALPAIPASSVNLEYWQSASASPVWGSKIANNIVSHTQHYANPTIAFDVDLVPGFYRLEAWGNAHSDAWPDGTNGLIELNQNLLPNGQVDLVSANSDPYSYMTVTIKTV